VRKGGNLVISAGDNVTPERYNAAFASVLPSLFRRVQDIADPGEVGVALALPDTRHSLFSPFARAGRGGFARVRSHRVLTLEPYHDTEDVHTLLRYEDGSPALVERTVGPGQVLVWTGSFDLAWGNLPLQSVFMPLVQRLVPWLGGDTASSAGRFDAVMGEVVSLPLPYAGIQPDVVGPDGLPVRSRIEAGRLVFTPEKAGAYQIHLEGAPPLAWVAVNHAVEESDVRPYDSLARMEQALVPELFMRHVDLGPWMLALALALAVLQGLIALRGSR
jgi:hypothetical protein